MYAPPHPGEMIRDILEDEDVGWTVTECARRLGMARNTLSRLLNGHIGISPRLALAMERIGWGDADHWMRVQAAYELAQARNRRTRLDMSSESVTKMGLTGGTWQQDMGK